MLSWAAVTESFELWNVHAVCDDSVNKGTVNVCSQMIHNTTELCSILHRWRREKFVVYGKKRKKKRNTCRCKDVRRRQGYGVATAGNRNVPMRPEALYICHLFQAHAGKVTSNTLLAACIMLASVFAYSSALRMFLCNFACPSYPRRHNSSYPEISCNCFLKLQYASIIPFHWTLNNTCKGGSVVKQPKNITHHYWYGLWAGLARSVKQLATGWTTEGSRIVSSPHCPDRLWGPPSLLSNENREVLTRE
jgi:hypothetical protein